MQFKRDAALLTLELSIILATSCPFPVALRDAGREQSRELQCSAAGRPSQEGAGGFQKLANLNPSEL